MALCDETAIADFADIAAMLEPRLVRQSCRFALKTRGDAIANRYMEILSRPIAQLNPSALALAVNGWVENRLIAMLDARVKASGTGKRLAMSPALREAFYRYDLHRQKIPPRPTPRRVARYEPDLGKRAEDFFIAVRNKLRSFWGRQ